MTPQSIKTIEYSIEPTPELTLLTHEGARLTLDQKSTLWLSLFLRENDKLIENGGI